MTYDCWYRTKIDVDNALNVDWKLPDKSLGNTWAIPAKDIFSEKWLQHMHEIQMPIVSALVFHKAANSTQTTAHVDMQKQGDPGNIGLNWLLSGEDSDMIWYENKKTTNNEVKGPQIFRTSSGTSYYELWNVSDLNEIDRCKITKTHITIVNPGLPHNILVGRENRWCISARLNIPNYVPYNIFVDHLQKSNLLLPR